MKEPKYNKGLERMKITKAERTDLKEILDLQYLSYQSEAVIYNNYYIQPLTQTIEELEKEFETQLILKALLDETIVGSVRAYEEEKSCKIGKLIVHPSFQGQGIGTKIMEEIELLFDKSERFELFTGHKSTRNLSLYNKLGYKTYKTKVIDKDLDIIFMEKPHKNSK
jgi:ribosomal protein S18 acetylase RimI-like enzyme